VNLTYDDEPEDDLTVQLSLTEPVNATSSASVKWYLKGQLLQYLIRLADGKKPVRLTKPPKLIWSWLAQRLMSPAQYRRLCEPHIADMHAQYFDCISKGDKKGARWAVIRGNLHAVPSWVWGVALTVLGWLKHWLSTA
jgi:hypothetical protein